MAFMVAYFICSHYNKKADRDTETQNNNNNNNDVPNDLCDKE